jgi:hypothetical protein
MSYYSVSASTGVGKYLAMDFRRNSLGLIDILRLHALHLVPVILLCVPGRRLSVGEFIAIPVFDWTNTKAFVIRQALEIRSRWKNSHISKDSPPESSFDVDATLSSTAVVLITLRGKLTSRDEPLTFRLVDPPTG